MKVPERNNQQEGHASAKDKPFFQTTVVWGIKKHISSERQAMEFLSTEVEGKLERYHHYISSSQRNPSRPCIQHSPYRGPECSMYSTYYNIQIAPYVYVWIQCTHGLFSTACLTGRGALQTSEN